MITHNRSGYSNALRNYERANRFRSTPWITAKNCRMWKGIDKIKMTDGWPGSSWRTDRLYTFCILIRWQAPGPVNKRRPLRETFCFYCVFGTSVRLWSLQIAWSKLHWVDCLSVMSSTTTVQLKARSRCRPVIKSPSMDLSGQSTIKTNSWWWDQIPWQPAGIRIFLHEINGLAYQYGIFYPVFWWEIEVISGTVPKFWSFQPSILTFPSPWIPSRIQPIRLICMVPSPDLTRRFHQFMVMFGGLFQMTRNPDHSEIEVDHNNSLGRLNNGRGIHSDHNWKSRPGFTYQVRSSWTSGIESLYSPQNLLFYTKGDAWHPCTILFMIMPSFILHLMTKYTSILTTDFYKFDPHWEYLQRKISYSDPDYPGFVPSNGSTSDWQTKGITARILEIKWSGSHFNEFWEYDRSPIPGVNWGHFRTLRKQTSHFSVGPMAMWGWENHRMATSEWFWEYHPEQDEWVRIADYPGLRDTGR